MPATPTPIQASTQTHLDIEDIIENIVLLKDGSAAMIITTTAVNFGLLSEAEQDATIYAYAALLNSLTFPIQVLIRSKRKDITSYEKLLSEKEAQTPKPENKERIRKYREFIQETVRQRNVLDKKFYLVVPFSVLELGVAKSAAAAAKGARGGLPFAKDYIISRAKMSLEPKRDHLIHQLSRLGLRSRQLTTKELIQLLFEIYNPDSAQGQILAPPEEYETPIVQPAVGFTESPVIETAQKQNQKPKTKIQDQPKQEPPTGSSQPTPTPDLKPEKSQPIQKPPAPPAEPPTITIPERQETTKDQSQAKDKEKTIDQAQETIDQALSGTIPVNQQESENK
jgi:hypothetical protein